MVLGMIKRGTRARPVPIAEIQEATGLSAREVKGTVHDLRHSYAQPVGSLRDNRRGGYFLCQTPDDVEATCRPLESPAREMLRLVAIIRKKTPRQVLAEQLGLFAEVDLPEPSEPETADAVEPTRLEGQVAA